MKYYWNSLSESDEVGDGFDRFVSDLAGFIRLVVFLTIGLLIGLYASSMYATHYINNYTEQVIMKGKP